MNQTDPGPLAEVEFWKSKSANLNGENQILNEILIAFVLFCFV